MNHSTALPSSVLALVLASLFALPSAHAQAVPSGPQALAGEVDPAVLQRELAASWLDLERAVTVKKVKLNVGLATLRLEDGILVPAVAAGMVPAEMVFLGKGRIDRRPRDGADGRSQGSLEEGPRERRGRVGADRGPFGALEAHRSAGTAPREAALRAISS